MIAAVVAVDSNWGIGKKNDLLFHIKDDMNRFKSITKNHCVIMGSKTYESLPNKPLPNRDNIIITRKSKKYPKVQEDGTIHANLKAIKIWLNEKEVIEENNGIYVIGGGFIYKELLSLCERVYVTKVIGEYEADTFFPNIDQMPEWKCVSKGKIKEENGIKYQFCVYDRIDYKIIDVFTHDNIKEISEGDMIINVQTFNTIKTVLLKPNDKHVVDTNWLHLRYKTALLDFIDKVSEYNAYKELHKEDKTS